MKLYIPTRGRPQAQYTWAALPWLWKRQTWLVIDRDEAARYGRPDADGYQYLVYDGGAGIGPKRQWILDHGADDAVMLLDDDLTFSVRRGSKLVAATAEDLEAALDRTAQLLREGWAAVGWSQRAGNNRVPEEYATVHRMMNAYAFNLPRVRATGARFDRLADSMEDFDFTLQLLETGEPNLVLYTVAVGQHDANAAGGCTEYLTPARQAAAAHQLAALHPGLVALKHKTTKGGWHGFTERTDVEIAWKKAYRQRAQTLLV